MVRMLPVPLLLGLLCIGSPVTARVIHVDASGPLTGWEITHSGDGDSWERAYQSVWAALEANRAVPGDEIWVARGTYLGSEILLEGGIALYGGFEGLTSTTYPGGETSRDERDPARNPTVLSGDVLGDDAGFENRDDNVARVVILRGDETGTPVISGLIITAGYSYRKSSGGISVSGAAVIEDCAVTLNGAGTTEGAGILVEAGSDVTIRGGEVSGNRTGVRGSGAGIYISRDVRATLESVTIRDNLCGRAQGMTNAGSGGGVYCGTSSTVTFEDCLVQGNHAGDGVESTERTIFGLPGAPGGGVYCGTESRVSLLRSRFEENTAGSGGGTCIGAGPGGDGGGVYSERTSRVDLEDCTFLGNEAGAGGMSDGPCPFYSVGLGGHGAAPTWGARDTFVDACSAATRRGPEVPPDTTARRAGTAGAWSSPIRPSRWRTPGSSRTPPDSPAEEPAEAEEAGSSSSRGVPSWSRTASSWTTGPVPRTPTVPAGSAREAASSSSLPPTPRS